ncbi:MAG: T9SS type A sorting domain-containing protein, partial [Candidatus Kapaibacterium sp.]
ITGGGMVFFPDVPEAMQIKNNIIWGLSPRSEDAVRFGVRLYTQRDHSVNMMDRFLTPAIADYFSENDLVANNTVIIESDGDIANEAPQAGIAIQQTENAVVMNNAIAMLDNNIAEDAEFLSAIFYHGTDIKTGGIHSDRNAYELSTDASIYRYVLTDNESNVIEMGEKDQFRNLTQWRAWTAADMNSVMGNFTNDLVYTTNIPSNLRVSDNPRPLGSILNNRGENLDRVTRDFADNPRGLAGQRYDIGAIEFHGRVYVSDLEVVSIIAPIAYRSNTGMFSDAEYLMTRDPIDVVARIRNNGSLQISGATANVSIYREAPDGTFESDPYLDEQATISVSPGQSIDLSFGLADRLMTDFYPQTYADLAETHTPPAQFRTMTANVTPRYKIVISLGADEHNVNNDVSKEVRFYLQRSPMGILVSVVNSSADIDDQNVTDDQMAGRLNYDSLMTAISHLGWIVDVDQDRYDIDVFDRNSWEPLSVNYNMYRTLLWADGDDEMLTRSEMLDITSFMKSGNPEGKKNMIIGSQEMVRENYIKYPEFVNEVLRASYAAPGNPLGEGVSNDGSQVRGINVLRNLVEDIAATGVDGDPEPLCGLMGVYEEGAGMPRVAVEYLSTSNNATDSTAGVATSSITETLVLFGVDWRHWAGSSEEIIRGSFDFVEKNGGIIIPVELMSFDARQRGRSVEIDWTTASEQNSSKFEVQRAEGNDLFTTVGQLPAAGQSGYQRHYGPVVDNDVQYGHTYVYRLKMIDKDGSFDLSDEKTVTVTGAEGEAWIDGVMPNPATVNTRLVYGLSSEMNVNVDLYDMAGRKVANVFKGMASSGINELPLETADLPNGVYTVLLTAGEIQVSAQFTVAR